MISSEDITAKSGLQIDYVENLTTTGDFQKISGINVDIKNIRNLLITPKGTYIMDPNYGSELYKKVFELRNDDTRDAIIFEVHDVVKYYRPDIKIVNIDVYFDTDIKGYQVDIVIEKNGIKDTVRLNINEYNANMGLDI